MPPGTGDDGWAAIVAWYDEKQGETGDLWHRALIDPPLIAAVGPVDGRRLLDLGSGNGYLARRFARDGARVLAVDAEPEAVARARVRGNVEGRVEYRQADGAALIGVPDGTFDLVYANMSLMDMADAAGALRESARVLRPDGRFVASISHPCFDNGRDSTWLVERLPRGATVIGRISRSYRSSFREEVPWRISDGSTATTAGYHRPLSWYGHAFRAAGLVIEDLDEPEPTTEILEQDPTGPYLAQFPLHLVIQARKPVG